MRRKRIRVLGIIQGVGFRPHVSKLAIGLGLVGSVRNDSSGVTIEIQGPTAKIDAFLDAMMISLPPLARIDSAVVSESEIVQQDTFIVGASEHDETKCTSVPADIAACEECLNEFNDPSDRRFRYPFINCTNCGPRFTIVESLPYDRERTTMKFFRMCAVCQLEYEDSASRRFHAQPNACGVCGPEIWFVDSSHARATSFEHPASDMMRGDDAVNAFHRAIADGLIVAVKGVGGFHLACDATNAEAIDRLRLRKGRVDKPFAVMMSSVDACRAVVHVSQTERELLKSPQRPIVLLRKCCEFAAWQPGARVVDGPPAAPTSLREVLADNIAPGNPAIGIMLAYAPLHCLLLETGRPLIMTSGNISDEPIVWQNAQAVQRLSQIADAYLFHDRPIASICDDSVVRVVDGDVLPIRRSRGYAPLPLRLADPELAGRGRVERRLLDGSEAETAGARVLAIGGEIKATFCVSNRQYAYLSQHIGNMENLETLEALERNVAHFLNLFHLQPQIVACDMHPGYVSTQWAREFSDQRKLPLLQVQHHHAHLAALACEHRLSRDEPLLGICFDGNGYGVDGTIWGGEVLLVKGSRYERLTHLQSMPLPGGEASIRKPYRIALAYMAAIGIPWKNGLACVQHCSSQEQKVLRQQIERGFNCPMTSSMGRLFDAVASLIGVRQQVNFEAQSAIELESLATRFFESTACWRGNVELSRDTVFNFRTSEYRFQFDAAKGTAINFDQLLRAMCADVQAGVDAVVISAKFHLAVAELIAELGELFCRRLGLRRLGLSGGVFQNALLLSLTKRLLRQRGLEALAHREVPTNDGGIALGQAWVAIQHQT